MIDLRIRRNGSVRRAAARLVIVTLSIAAPVAAAPPDADLDGDGVIGTGDLLAILGAWENGSTCADLDGDGEITAQDLLIVLTSWGEAAPPRDPFPARAYLTPSAIDYYGYYGYSGALIDLDCDGDLDFLEPFDDDRIAILLNDGSAAFKSTAVIEVPEASITVIATGAFDGDGITDLAVAGGNAGTFVLPGDGAGGLAAPITIPVPATRLAVADFDGDGLDDLVTALEDESAVTVIFNDGTRFERRRRIELGGRVDVVSTFDVDGGGRPDLVVIAGSMLHVYLNHGAGDLRPAGISWLPAMPTTEFHAAASGDFDGDGHVDLVVSGRLHHQGIAGRIWIARNTGDGRLVVEQMLAMSGYAVYLLAADPDSDGDLDIMVADGRDEHLLRNDGSGAFTIEPFPGPRYLAGWFSLADLDGDGCDDLFTSSQGVGLISVASAYRSQRFRQAIQAPSAWGPIAAVDIAGDGDLDLLVRSAGSSSTKLTVLTNPGDGAFTVAGEFEAGGEPAAIEVGRLNDDQYPDFAVLTEDETLAVIYGQPGGFSLPESVTEVGSETALVVADFDGDGLDDIAVGGPELKILWNGVHGLSAPQVVSPVLSTQIGAGDVDQDGAIDLVTSNGSTLTVVWNGGRGRSWETLGMYLGQTLHRPFVTDLTGDGLPDVGVPQYWPAEGAILILAGRGNRLLDPPLEIPTWTYAWLTAVGDFDLDGDPDLVVQAYHQAAGFKLLRNDGGGRFHDLGWFATKVPGPAFLAADVDGDGDLDIVTKYASHLTVTLNQTRLCPP